MTKLNKLIKIIGQWSLVSGLWSLVFLNGCALRYQPYKHGTGYYDYKIQDDIYAAGYRGAASQEKSEDFALLRASEVALANGYAYFVIIKETAQEDRHIVTQPATVTTYGIVGRDGFYRGTAFAMGHDDYHYDSPSTRDIIRCFKAKPKGTPKDAAAVLYDAAQVRDNLRARYKLDDVKPR